MNKKDLVRVIREEVRKLLSESEIQVLGINKYVAAIGNKPRGYGKWWFHINDKTYTFQGYYPDVVKQAKAKAKELGVNSVEVLP